MKALVGAYNQEKALIGAFSMIVKTDGSFAALILEPRPQLCPECGGLCNGWSGPHLVIVSLLNTKYPGSHVLNLGLDMSHYVLKSKVIY